MTQCSSLPSTEARRGVRPARAVVGLVAAAVLLAGSIACGRSGASARPAGKPAAEASSASRPAATQPVKPWKPPRFAAHKADRARMVRTIRSYGMKDPAVVRAMAAVPRHAFVPRTYRSDAHRDSPLPIGYGQTISQPYMVAEMTRMLKLKAGSRVLEIGTGSGYQAAVLTELTRHVYTIEIIRPLADAAKKRFADLGYHVIESKCGDGYYGWAKKGPFDAIIVTCAAGQVPPPLVKQLTPGGRMVIPVGGPFATQHLLLIEKAKNGSVRSRAVMAVRFVPLRRKDITAK